MDEKIRVGGRRIRVRRFGAGRPVLLLNGVAMGLGTWEPIAGHLDGFECLGVAIPGSIENLGAQPVVTMRGFASLTAGLLDALDLDRVDVLGVSFGGLVAQQLAHDAPGRVGKMVLASTHCGLGAVPSNPLSWWNALVADGATPVDLMDPLWWPRQWSNVARREFGAGWEYGPRFNGLLAQFAAASTWSSLPWLTQLTNDTLVITGTADALIPPENSDILAARLPNADLYRVRGGGHLCLVDRADELGPVVAKFLSAGDTCR